MKDFDPFAAKKQESFTSSLQQISSVATFVSSLYKNSDPVNKSLDQIKIEFEHLVLVSGKDKLLLSPYSQYGFLFSLPPSLLLSLPPSLSPSLGDPIPPSPSPIRPSFPPPSLPLSCPPFSLLSSPSGATRWTSP